MTKFKKVRLAHIAKDEQAEKFADAMDMVARERALLKIYDGKSSLQVHGLTHAIKRVSHQLNIEYDKLTRLEYDELVILRRGIVTLTIYWKNHHSLMDELPCLLLHPERFDTFNGYLKELVRHSELERIIRALGETDDDQTTDN